MSQDEAFIQNILDHPEDPGLRLIYADWLDEQNDPRGSYLRLEAKMMSLPEDKNHRRVLMAQLRKMSQKMPRDWLIRLDRTPIDNCADLNWEFKCPKRWEELEETDDKGVRFCTGCSKNVYHCPTTQNALEHARLGHCVAVDSCSDRLKLEAPPQMMVLGMPTRPSRGERVRIVAGEYQGFVGSLEQFDRRKRQVVLHIIIGSRPVLVVVRESDVAMPR